MICHVLSENSVMSTFIKGTPMSLCIQVTSTSFMVMGRKHIQTEKATSPIGNQRMFRIFVLLQKQSYIFMNISPPSCFRATQLWPAALDESRVQAHISDVISVENPT